MTEQKTPEQVVAETLERHEDDWINVLVYQGIGIGTDEMAGAVVAALREAGMLVEPEREWGIADERGFMYSLPNRAAEGHRRCIRDAEQGDPVPGTKAWCAMTYTDDQIEHLAEKLRQIAESQRMDFDSPHVAMTLDESAAALAQVKAENAALRDAIRGALEYMRTVRWDVPGFDAGESILSQALQAEDGEVHADWCHKVTGCSEPGHCSCDASFTPVPQRTKPTPTSHISPNRKDTPPNVNPEDHQNR